MVRMIVCVAAGDEDRRNNDASGKIADTDTGVLYGKERAIERGRVGQRKERIRSREVVAE